MRFYEKKQVEMLEATYRELKNAHEQVSARVPALKELIKEYEERYMKLEALKSRNKSAILHETINKSIVKDAFAEVVMKLSGVDSAANYGKKTTAKFVER